MRMKLTGERWVRSASVCVLVACLATVTLTTGLIRRAISSQEGKTGYRVGVRVDVPPEWLRGDGCTLLVFLRSDCLASQTSAGLLPQMRREIPVGIEVVAVVSTRGGDREVAFAESAGFERAHVRTANFDLLRLQAVPALLLLDRNGVVKMERLGTSQQTGRVDLAAELSRLAPAL